MSQTVRDMGELSEQIKRTEAVPEMQSVEKEDAGHDIAACSRPP
jgi:hypothetical protein